MAFNSGDIGTKSPEEKGLGSYSASERLEILGLWSLLYIHTLMYVKYYNVAVNCQGKRERPCLKYEENLKQWENVSENFIGRLWRSRNKCDCKVFWTIIKFSYNLLFAKRKTLALIQLQCVDTVFVPMQKLGSFSQCRNAILYVKLVVCLYVCQIEGAYNVFISL